MYFDELGQPWPKHPCMDYDHSSVESRNPDESIKGLEPLTSGAIPVILLFRPRALYFGIEIEYQVEWFTGKLDLTKRYLPGAWIIQNKHNNVRTLQFLTEDIDPVEIAVRPAKEPTILSDKTIAGSLRNHKKAFQSFVMQLNLPSKPKIATLNDNSFFGVAQIGNSRLLIIPLVADQNDDENKADEIKSISDLFRYNRIKVAMSTSQKIGFRSSFFYADQVLIVGTDPFSLSQGNKSSIFQRGLKTKNRTSLYEFSYDKFPFDLQLALEDNLLEDDFYVGRLGSPIVSWCNMIDVGIGFDEISKTTDDALLTERLFCQKE